MGFGKTSASCGKLAIVWIAIRTREKAEARRKKEGQERVH
tara:strand:- start:148 stop:267 length:120 start_codon:yes stop_codon:yes gene_type:complete